MGLLLRGSSNTMRAGDVGSRPYLMSFRLSLGGGHQSGLSHAKQEFRGRMLCHVSFLSCLDYGTYKKENKLLTFFNPVLRKILR